MKTKPAFKLSTVILFAVFMLLVIGVFASSFALKNVYQKVDKSDNYWNYNAILEQPYKHLKLEGGSITNLIFEPGARSSVRVLNYWREFKKDVTLKAYVKNDTLHIVFPNKYPNESEKQWMQRTVLVRLFSPQLLSIDASDTNFELQKLKQDNISIKLRGKSRVEVESYKNDLGSINVTQSDSSQVVFEMAPEFKGSKIMHFNSVSANLSGYSLLDIGRGNADNVKMNIIDSAAVILSGKSLKAVDNTRL